MCVHMHVCVSMCVVVIHSYNPNLYFTNIMKLGIRVLELIEV
jgi:hypothetical protein